MKIAPPRWLAALALAALAAAAWAGSNEPRDWIIVLENRATLRAVLEELPSEVLGREYSLLPAFVARLTAEEAEAIAALPGVRSVEPNQRIGISPVAQAAPLIDEQVVPWGVAAVRAPEAWNASNKGAGAVVAILDTGMKLDHPDLPTPLATASFVTGETVDDGHGHGTAVAGTVAALDNSIGVVGVAPEANLLIGKVLNNAGSGTYADVIAGIDWAVLQGADVINMSFGGSGDPALEAAVDAAWAAGALVVAAAGDGGSSFLVYPAAYPSAISVNAIDDNEDLSWFSNFGATIDLTAPGVGIVSTWAEGTLTAAAAEWDGSDREARPITGSSVGAVSGGVYDCGLGTGSGGDSCPPSVSGNIAHIRWGSISVSDKVTHATSAGATGVILSNNAPGGPFPASVFPDSALVLVTVSQADGDDLISLGDGTAATIETIDAPYITLSSTARAAPHVSGTLALLAGCAAPGMTAIELRNAVEATAKDLGVGGWDAEFGHGLVNALAALSWVPGCPLSADAGPDRIGGSAASAFVGVPLGGAPAASGGRGPYSIQWTGLPAAGFMLSDPAAANPVFTGTSAGTYVLDLDVSDAAGAMADDDVTVQVECPTDLEITGQTLTGAIGTYEAIQSIVASNSSLAPGADVDFRAGLTVALRNGFSIPTTASFSAILDPSADCEP